MELVAYRLSRGLTQEEAAKALGLRSKGYFSRLERGLDPISLRLALKIERWSGGEVLARDLNRDAAALLPSPSAPEVRP